MGALLSSRHLLGAAIVVCSSFALPYISCTYSISMGAFSLYGAVLLRWHDYCMRVKIGVFCPQSFSDCAVWYSHIAKIVPKMRAT